MTTTDLIRLGLSLLAGAAIGAGYFRALWWTIERLSHARRPALLLLGSSFARIVMAVGLFWVISGGRWQRLLACVLGFMIARLVMIRACGPHATAPDADDREAVAHGPGG